MNATKDILKDVDKILDMFPMGGGVSYVSGSSTGCANFTSRGKKLFKQALEKIIDGFVMKKCPRCNGAGFLVKDYDPKPLMNNFTYEECNMCYGVKYIFVDPKELF